MLKPLFSALQDNAATLWLKAPTTLFCVTQRAIHLDSNLLPGVQCLQSKLQSFCSDPAFNHLQIKPVSWI
jgi:hypothetical protein